VGLTVALTTVCLSVCLPVCVSVCLCVCLSVGNALLLESFKVYSWYIFGTSGSVRTSRSSSQSQGHRSRKGVSVSCSRVDYLRL